MTATDVHAPERTPAGGQAPARAAEESTVPAGPVDTEALRRFVDGTFRELREKCRAELPLDLFEPADHLTTAEHRDRTRDQLRRIVAMGGHELGFSSRYGGGDDPGGQVSQFEMLGFGDASLMIKSGVQFGLFAGSVQALGTERHHTEVLPRALKLDLVGCFAMTESGHGSDVASLSTTATYDAATQEFVIHSPDAMAQKEYIGGAAEDAEMAVVFAQLETKGERHGVHALLVPIRRDGQALPGITLSDCGRKAGLNGVDNGRIMFDQVRVPRTALLDRYAQVAEDGTYSSLIKSANARFFTMLGALVKGRVSISGGALSQTKIALAIALRHALNRRQFGRPGTDEEVLLLDYLSHQRRLLIPLATTYALTFAQDELLQAMHEVVGAQLRGREVDTVKQRAFEAQAAGMKAASSWHATATIQTCREACGGAGYLSENRLPQLKADSDIFTTFEGDNTVLLQLVAKSLLTQYKQQFSDLDTLGMAKFATLDFVSTVAGRSPARLLVQEIIDSAPRRGDGEEELHSRAWQLQLVQYREKHVVETLAKRARRAQSKSEGRSFEALNALQDHMIMAGRAHVDRVVLEAFTAAVARCEDPGVKALLEQVCDLHALALLEAEKGWYLQHRRISPVRAKQITHAVNDALAKLRPRTEELLAGFGIPEAWLQASVLQR
ncbi:acyl-CoA oxidase [Kineococcus xinjiangensis]|uniref:acyl-CoA oxidase n=1 Tax=Kineococcus xinjiangensis TaxID=512762 RepID=A0A2S6ID38_9ACTN|nr:acyl-CoA dehydrogenase family protein [Kineococcus xinjiangensis]PPK92121.1 acyl-CoA oxidase [Kineococcus xinjiangensis]